MFRPTKEGYYHLRSLELMLDRSTNDMSNSLIKAIDRQYQCLMDIKKEGISGDWEQLSLFLSGTNPAVELVEDV